MDEHDTNELPQRVVYRNTPIRSEADLERAIGPERLAKLKAAAGLDQKQKEQAIGIDGGCDGLAKWPGTELVATCKVRVISMCVFKDRLFVATSEGVFERLDDGAFHEVQFVPVENDR